MYPIQYHIAVITENQTLCRESTSSTSEESVKNFSIRKFCQKLQEVYQTQCNLSGEGLSCSRGTPKDTEELHLGGDPYPVQGISPRYRGTVSEVPL